MDNNAIQLILQQAKTDAILHEIREDVQSICNHVDVCEIDRVKDMNTYNNHVHSVQDQFAEANAIVQEIRADIKKLHIAARRLTVVGISLIFGGSIVSQMDLLAFLSKLL
jgi:hypothetical protein